MQILSLVLFAIPFMTLVGLVLLVAALVQRAVPAPSEAAAAARRHAVAVNAAAWVTAPVVALLGVQLLRTVWSTGLYAGVAAGLLPAVLGLVFLGVHAIGERTWPRPEGSVRRANLSPRATPRGPRWLRRLTWTWAGLLVAALVVAGATSSNGRAVTAPYASNAVVSAGPYPGWYYGIPLLIAAALVLAATEGVLRLIGRRPAVVDADPAYDAASRELSAHRALRGVHLVLALTVGGVLSVMGSALGRLQDEALLVVGNLVSGLAVVVVLGALVVTVIPGRPARSAAPAPAIPPQGADTAP